MTKSLRQYLIPLVIHGPPNLSGRKRFPRTLILFFFILMIKNKKAILSLIYFLPWRVNQRKNTIFHPESLRTNLFENQSEFPLKEDG